MTKAKLYYSSESKYYKQIVGKIEKSNMEYLAQNLHNNPYSWEQLLEVLTYTENGIDDILATKSLDYKHLVKQGIDFEDLTLTDFHKLVARYPKLIRSPITLVKGTLLIGYNEEDMSVLENRQDRVSRYNEILSLVQSEEVFEYDILTL